MYASIGNSGKKKLVSLRYDLIGTFLYSQTKSRDALQSGYFFMGKPIYEVHRELVGVLTASYKLCHKTITPEALTLVGKKFHHGLGNFRKKFGTPHLKVSYTKVKPYKNFCNIFLI